MYGYNYYTMSHNSNLTADYDKNRTTTGYNVVTYNVNNNK